ncbi:hypothetical protein KAX02_02800 [candidate division WOR-3 bacterium]|nr:hypothetical protein [candidate division WOR-3 bacterium]
MEIALTKNQIAELQEFLDEVELDYTSGAKGVIQAQVYGGFMSVFYIKNKCAMEMREVIKRHYPERFSKKEY